MSTVDDICDGVLCALEKVSARVLSGQEGNLIGGVNIGTDGTITLDGGSGTTITSEESRNGAAYGVKTGLQALLDDVELWLTTLTPTDAKQYVQAKYYMTGDVSTVIDNIDALLTTEDPYYVDTDDNLVEEIFCTQLIRGSVSSWIIDHATASANQKDVMLQLLSVISDQQLLLWYTNGSLVPLDDFRSFACHIREMHYIDYDALDYDANSDKFPSIDDWDFTSSSQRAIRIKLSGVLTDENGVRTLDPLWYVADASTPPVAARNAKWQTLETNNANTNLFPADNPPYNASGNYEYTIVIPSQDVLNIQFRRGTGADVLTNPTGSLHLEFYDLGEV